MSVTLWRIEARGVPAAKAKDEVFRICHIRGQFVHLIEPLGAEILWVVVPACIPSHSPGATGGQRLLNLKNP